MKKQQFTAICLFVAVAIVATMFAGNLSATKPKVDEAWAKTVEQNAAKQSTFRRKSDKVHKFLVFSLATGYKHTVIPNVDRVFQILGRVSGAFQATISRDIEDLSAEKLKKYDVLVLNNTCSKGARRNLFLDVLESDVRYKNLSETERQAKSDSLETSILDFVRGGKGLVVMHGAPTLLNNSPKFTEMVGGAFDYHPPNQIVTVRVVDPKHPLAAAFRGKGPLVYRDEPYCFKGAYAKKNFQPLLEFDQASVKDRKNGKFRDDARYSAWIKSFGKGRVFYCSPGHFPEIYENPLLLQFLLDGILYAADDWKST